MRICHLLYIFISKIYALIDKGLSFNFNCHQWKEGTRFVSELTGIEPTLPAQEERGMLAFSNYDC
jgi:hypothetical protein